jgi:hypothetical protein
MKRMCSWALLLALPLLVALIVPAAAGKTPAPRMLVTPPIWVMAMDGPRVAYNTQGDTNKILVWNVLTGTRTLVSGAGTRATHVGSLAIFGLAIAGKRVAWITVDAGNLEYDETLYTSSLPAPKERKLAQAVRFANEDPKGRDLQGAWIHGLVGSGDLLAVSRWSTGADGSTLPGGGLYLVTGSGLRQIVAGSNGIVAEDSDAGRIAVLRSSGVIRESFIYKPSEVAIYGATGKLLKRLKPAGIDQNGVFRMAEVALQGNDLAVLTPQQRLELYNWRTGALLHNWRVPKGARQLDLYGQIATYIVGFESSGLRLHVVGMRTGKDNVLARAVGPLGFVDAEIEAPGLAYAVNAHSSQVTFVPMARVLTVVSRGHRW